MAMPESTQAGHFFLRHRLSKKLFYRYGTSLYNVFYSTFVLF